MKQKAIQFYSSLPPWAKGVVAVGGTAMVVVIGLGIYNNIQKAADRRRQNLLSENAGRELLELAKKGIRPTINKTQAESMASSLVSAFDDCGTDESAVFRVISALKNEADVYLLIQVYGVRQFKGCFSNYFGFENLNLPAAITYEMGSGEVSKINSILQKNGISFRF